MQLLNRAQLAEAIGRDPSYVSAMRKAGLQFTCGKITLRAALAWMAAHPDFTTRDAYPRTLTQMAGRGRSRQRKSVSGTRHSVPA